MEAQPGPWGWKDPRNTFTLPLWLEVFPSARVLNVYRNGVDVAESLVVRERRRVARIHNAVRSCRCLSHERAFELWTEYVTTSLRLTAALAPDRVHQVRYESFLEAPESGLRDLAAFLGLDLSDAELRSARGRGGAGARPRLPRGSAAGPPLPGDGPPPADAAARIRRPFVPAGELTVDVILPTHAGERWVAEAIESVLRQTHPLWRPDGGRRLLAGRHRGAGRIAASPRPRSHLPPPPGSPAPRGGGPDGRGSPAPAGI